MDNSPPVYERAEPAPLKPRRKPPVGRRFPPGTSGNPAGRPRRLSTPSTPAALERAMKGRVTVETGGRPRRLSVTEAVIQSMIDRALAGDNTARRDLLKAKAEVDAAAAARREAARLAREERARAEAEEARFLAEAEPAPAHACGAHLREALAILGAGTPHPEWTAYGGRRQEGKVTLDSWVVEAAFARDPQLEARLDGVQCQTVLRAMNGEYSGMYERYGGDRQEEVEETPVMLRLLARARHEWARTRELFLPADEGRREADAEAPPPPAPPPPAPPPAPPPPAPPPAQAAAEPPAGEDFIDRLCRRGGLRGPGDWMA